MPASDLPRRSELGRTFGLAAAHAVLFSMAFPPAGLWPLMLVSAFPLAWLALTARSRLLASFAVLVVQTGMWLWIDRWLIDVTTAGYPLLAVYKSLYAVLFLWLVRGVDRALTLPCTVTVPVVWVGLEFLRGEVLFYGYSWYLAAHAMIEVPKFVQTADLLGTYFVSFIAMAHGGLCVDVMRWRGRELEPQRFWTAAVSLLLLLMLNALYGVHRLRQPAVLPGPTVLAVQTNLPQSNKIGWSVEEQVRDVRRFVNLTVTGLEAARELEEPPDMVVWPETMLPGLGLEPETTRVLVEGGFPQQQQFVDVAAEVAQRAEAPFLVGAPTYLGFRAVEGRWEWDAHHNAAYLVHGNPPYARYDKVFLTPFGEVMPYVSAWPWLEQKLLAIGAGGMRFDLDPGGEIYRFDLPRTGFRFATPICFEDAVASVCRRMVYPRGRKELHFLVNLSNDGWLGDNDAAREHHVQVARFRCIENRVPMIRAVNTGFTVAIGSVGQLIEPLMVTGPGPMTRAREPATLLAELKVDTRSTVYGRIGDIWGWGCLALVAASVVWLAVLALQRRWGNQQ